MKKIINPGRRGIIYSGLEPMIQIVFFCCFFLFLAKRDLCEFILAVAREKHKNGYRKKK